MTTRLMTLLVGLLGLSGLSCDHRAATATGLPVLYVPPDAPTEEPPPAPLLGETNPPPVSKPTPSATADGGVGSEGKIAPPGEPVKTADPVPAKSPKVGSGETGTEIACDGEAPSGMVCIPGGPFWRGADDGKPDEKPRNRAVVSPFFLDTYEVTNDQYFRCVEAGRCDPPIKYYPLFAHAKQPVVAVSWYEAYDFCKFAGKRLPTEAEWEKAARGPNGDVYPWGNQPATCDKANYEHPLGAKGCGTGITSAVGSRPPNRYGLYDMAGNSWEWVNDWKSDCYAGCSKPCGEDCAGPDPKGPCGGGPGRCPGYHEKILKGGSWYFTAERMRGAERRGVPPSNRGPHRLGFRCAKSVH
ncbi:MAG TPA: SUMF1/EgtB/PvdO family nonheme iron enzyme [Pseudomonadota bacterium]|nr:SUMF1/EgtB/PvdO family nonheme iron enzyme [Pseudomonadota bacterium]